MTIKDEHHQLVDELDEDSAEEALAYLQSRCRRRALGEARIDDVTGAGEEQAAALEGWEDEGGSQAGHAVDERSGERPRASHP